MASSQGSSAVAKNAKAFTITIDAETKTIVETEQASLEVDLGFKPTLSQTVRHIIKKSTAHVPAQES